MINLTQPIPSYANPVRPRPLSQRVDTSIQSLLFALVALLALVSLVYLAHANRNATKGYALKNMELRRSALVTENEVWDMQIARAQALENIQKDPKVLSMIRAEKPQFIRGDSAIASR